MSIYNLLLGYKSSVVPPGGDIGFSDNTPGNNKSYKLPYFNTIKIEIWGAGGGGGGGDHSNEYDGGSGGTSKITTFNVVVVVEVVELVVITMEQKQDLVAVVE